MRGDKIVVPDRLRTRMLEIADEGHQGQIRTKQLLRAHVWFVGLDDQYAKFVSTCIYCQANTSKPHREPTGVRPAQKENHVSKGHEI